MRRNSRTLGFTLLELMIGITVAGILLGLGVPAFNQLIRNNRTIAETNELMTALTLARSEATRRGIAVSVCASNAAHTECEAVDANDWQNGWLVFTDRDGDPGAVDPEDEILQISRSVGAQLKVESNDLGFVRFDASGARTNTDNVELSVQHQECTGANRRRIVVNATGRATLTKVPCS